MKREKNPDKRWVVREADGATIGEILKRAGEGERAVEEGRVFLGRARVRSASEAVRAGDEVRIGGASAPDRQPAWSVLWEKEELLACNKEAGIPTVPDHLGASHALVALAAESRGRKASELFVTSRLDREVSGVVLFAMTSRADEHLRRARDAGRYRRRYVAIAQADEGDERLAQTGVWSVSIGAGRDPRHRAAFGPDAKEASTRFSVVARAGGFAMLAVEPQTGRTHQIRVHASHAGAPLLGDRDYGGKARVTLPAHGRVVALTRIALHAARVTVPSAAMEAEALIAEAPIPAELALVWRELGGKAEAWDMALSCELRA